MYPLGLTAKMNFNTLKEAYWLGVLHKLFSDIFPRFPQTLIDPTWRILANNNLNNNIYFLLHG